jgi:hypothetical protein
MKRNGSLAKKTVALDANRINALLPSLFVAFTSTPLYGEKEIRK